MKTLKHILLVLFVLISSSNTLSAQTPTEITAKFDTLNLETDNLSLQSRLFVPESYVPEDKYPLVLALHGAGERGDDNNIQVLVNNMATTWGTDEFQAEHPCFIFAPQCPPNLDWTTTRIYDAVMILLDSIIDKYSVDTTRIYITGLSMGGIGSWYYMLFDPDKYAAAMPICGGIYGNDEENLLHIETIRNIPVWDFHGGTDNVVPTDLSRKIMEIYKDLYQIPLLPNAYGRQKFNVSNEDLEDYIDNHVDLLYSEIYGVGHVVWNHAYLNPLAKEWMFQQRLRSPDNIVVDGTGESIKVSGSKEFSYTISEMVDSIGVWYGQLDTAHMEFIGGMRPVKGSFTFDSEAHDDFPYSILKFLAFDEEGYVIGKDYSDVLCINNEGNAPPYIELLNDVAQFSNVLLSDEYTMEVLVADPEADPLHISFEYSLDNGASFEAYADADADEGIYEQLIVFYDFYNSDETVLRASVTDGEHTVSALSLDFRNKYGYVNSFLSLKANNFKIYPNPANEFLHLEFDAFASGMLEIKLVSMNGRVMEDLGKEKIAAGKRSHSMPINELETGSYILQVNMDGKNQLSRLVVVE